MLVYSLSTRVPQALHFALYTTPFSHCSRESRSREEVEKSLSDSLTITSVHDEVDADYKVQLEATRSLCSSIAKLGYTKTNVYQVVQVINRDVSAFSVSI